MTHSIKIQDFDDKAGVSILGILLLAVIIILVLGYYHISLRAVVETSENQDNIQYVQGGSRSVWNDYLKEPFSYLWQDVWVNIFWKGFILNMERIRDGQPTDLDKAGQNLQLKN